MTSGRWDQEIPPASRDVIGPHKEKVPPPRVSPATWQSPKGLQTGRIRAFVDSFAYFHYFPKFSQSLLGAGGAGGVPILSPPQEAAAWPEPLRASGSLQRPQTRPHPWGHARVIGAAQAAAAEIRWNRAPARTGTEAAAGWNSAPAPRASLLSLLAWRWWPCDGTGCMGWDWAAVPGGHPWRGLPGVTLSSPGARHCSLPWGRGVCMERFLVPSNGHRPGDPGEDRDCASLAASARAFAALRGARAGACPELRTSTLRS